MSQKEECLESLANHDMDVIYETNEEDIKKLLVYTLGMLET